MQRDHSLINECHNLSLKVAVNLVVTIHSAQLASPIPTKRLAYIAKDR
jgi:hypothetical protein